MATQLTVETGWSREESGFTLLEVLIALAIFSIGILGVAALQSGSIRGNSKARAVTDIAVVATDRLEMLRSLPYNDAALADGAHVLDPESDRIDNNFNGLIDEDDETGPLTLQYTVATDWPLQRTKTVVVTATHTGLAGAADDKTATVQQIIPLII